MIKECKGEIESGRVRKLAKAKALIDTNELKRRFGAYFEHRTSNIEDGTRNKLQVE